MIFRPAPYITRDFEVISPASEESFGSRGLRTMNASVASMTWTANLAVFIPFGISQPFLVREVFWMTGSGVASNIDVGLYDTAGNRLASLGSTASGTVSGINTSTLWADYTLAAGDYFMAFSCSGTTNAVTGWATTAQVMAGLGAGQQALGSVTLPNPATIVQLATATTPYFGLNGNTVAA